MYCVKQSAKQTQRRQSSIHTHFVYRLVGMEIKLFVVSLLTACLDNANAYAPALQTVGYSPTHTNYIIDKELMLILELGEWAAFVVLII